MCPSNAEQLYSWMVQWKKKTTTLYSSPLCPPFCIYFILEQIKGSDQILAGWKPSLIFSVAGDRACNHKTDHAVCEHSKSRCTWSVPFGIHVWPKTKGNLPEFGQLFSLPPSAEWGDQICKQLPHSGQIKSSNQIPKSGHDFGIRIKTNEATNHLQLVRSTWWNRRRTPTFTSSASYFKIVLYALERNKHYITHSRICNMELCQWSNLQWWHSSSQSISQLSSGHDPIGVIQFVISIMVHGQATFSELP